MTDAAKRPTLSLAAYGCVVYLSLPVFAFLLGWVALPLGYVLAGLLFGLLVFVYREYVEPLDRRGRLSPHDQRRLALCLAAALVWVFSGGIGHFIFATYDWAFRDGILRDLTFTDWPVGYASKDGLAAVLRVPLGYYLIPALAGKIAGYEAAAPAVFINTALGVFLFFLVITERSARLRYAAILLTVFALFSGMKLIGVLLMQQVEAGHWVAPLWPPYMHLWARFAHYSSVTTELYYCPNHAMPAMLLAGLWWRYRDAPRLLQIGALAVPVATLWSPFATLGIAPFLAYSLIQHRKALFAALSPFLALGPLLVMAPALFYMTRDIGHVPYIWIGGSLYLSPVLIVKYYLPFVTLEFVALIFFLFQPRRPLLLPLIAVVLATLPLFWLGFYSDFAQQTALASLMILALFTGHWLIENAGRWRGGFRYDIAVIVILAIGAITPLQEIYINYTSPRWDYNPDCTLIDAWKQSKINPSLAEQIAYVKDPEIILQPRAITAERADTTASCWPKLKWLH